MPRYFFNIRLDNAYLHEGTGQCAPDAAAAWGVARTIVSSLLAQYGGDTRLLDAVLDVRDELGQPVFELSFFDAIYVPVQPPVPNPARNSSASAVSLPPRVGGIVNYLEDIWRGLATLVARRTLMFRSVVLEIALKPRGIFVRTRFAPVGMAQAPR